MDSKNMSDAAILAEIGQRLRRARLNQNMTQADLAHRAGIGRRTLQKAEDGQVTTLETLVAILRGLGLLAQLDQFLPEPPPSPVELAKLQGRTRQRASGRRDADQSDTNWNWEQ
jgi:transcriptional regulator with XRE-family HTH domain